MGRRAKNKQGDPESLQELVEHASPKKLGKRKAGMAIDRQQPAKKAKNSVNSTQKHTKSANSKEISKHKSETESGSQEDDAWNGIEEDGSSGGWEDIRDEGDPLPTQTRCESSCASRAATYLTSSNAVDCCFRIAI
jgi:ribosomal RNA methyltransferase Nop2